MTARRIAAAVAFTLCLVTAPGARSAEEKAEFNTSYGIRDVLALNTGKKVALRMCGGDELEGTLAQVGTHVVVLAKLHGRDFYDATIPIEKISAVIVKVRGGT